MDATTFQLRWEVEDDGREVDSTGAVVTEEVICGLDGSQAASYNSIMSEAADTDQIAAENLMYLSQDVMAQMSYSETAGEEVECVTEEVVTDDWTGQDRVEVPVEFLGRTISESNHDEDLDVPLPTDQDEYTAMRPYPCDFCSRRFRKKAALMNHMVAHQNDRPHVCNLCGMRYVRKADLMNHLKTHAFVPDPYNDDVSEHVETRKKKRGRRKRTAIKEEENTEQWEHMTSARTQQWSRRPTAPPAPPRTPTPPPRTPTPPPRAPTPLLPSDPRKPFVCQQCGVGFAREKALQSHSRMHGGESPIECGRCGELCWSREALGRHTRQHHPQHAASRATDPEPYQPSSDEYNTDLDYSSENERSVSPPRSRVERRERDRETRADAVYLAPELYCRDCGVAFQRTDLLRRHVRAAHSHKRHDSETQASDVSGTEHTCDVCGESCPDALTLLAHAEGHARQSSTRSKRSGHASKTFPCRECGKVFGSRSSQQIHVRIHTGERPYGCRFCWKAFADGGTLRKHERIHTGEKPYACAVCPRAFNQRVVLREHIRSHHSAPDHRRAGGVSFCCPVCQLHMDSSSDLVFHLIEHCDANTALRRQPQSGPRKYKRRRKLSVKEGPMSDEEKGDWCSPPRLPSPSPSPPPPPPPARPRPKRRQRRVAPAPRPKMIHTEQVVTRPRTKNVRTTTTSHRPPAATFSVLSTEPADDLRHIMPTLKPDSPEAPAMREPVSVKREPSEEGEANFRCEICSLEFRHRDDLLIHVPVHI